MSKYVICYETLEGQICCSKLKVQQKIPVTGTLAVYQVSSWMCESHSLGPLQVGLSFTPTLPTLALECYWPIADVITSN